MAVRTLNLELGQSAAAGNDFFLDWTCLDYIITETMVNRARHCHNVAVTQGLTVTPPAGANHMD